MIQLLNLTSGFLAEIKAIRHDIHAHPELGYQEQRTSDLIADKLMEWGIPVIRGLGKTGVVGILKNGSSERKIGLRADMDALAMQELNTYAHASKNEGKMHACGHDGHIAILLGAAACLAQDKRFDGTVYAIFQPAEETYSGAARMLKDGLLEKCPMDAIYGLHNWPSMPFGYFGICDGPAMASSNTFDLIVKGHGGHGGQPHHSIDPLMTAVHIAQGWQTIISRNKNPVDPAVLSITQIHSGSAANVISDTAFMNGTVRAFSTEMLDLIESRMLDMATHTAMAFGATIDFRFYRSYPPLINDQTEAARLAEMLQALVGSERVLTKMAPVMVSEDFSFYLERIPGCYAFLGSQKEESHSDASSPVRHGLHSPYYDFNDDLIPLGINYWVNIVYRFLPLIS